MLEPETQVNGAVVIFDMDGLSLQQTWQFTPQFAKRIVDWLQDCVPMRVKAIHIINQPKIFNVVFALFKPFLREKLRSRIIFHGTDRPSLHKHISPKCLPPCYGGTSEIPRVNGDQWYDLLLKCDQEYYAINSYGYNKNGVTKKKWLNAADCSSTDWWCGAIHRRNWSLWNVKFGWEFLGYTWDSDSHHNSEYYFLYILDISSVFSIHTCGSKLNLMTFLGQSPSLY